MVADFGGGCLDMLKSLKLRGVGPVQDLSATFGERLNVLTGDNGKQLWAKGLIT